MKFIRKTGKTWKKKNYQKPILNKYVVAKRFKRVNQRMKNMLNVHWDDVFINNLLPTAGLLVSCAGTEMGTAPALGQTGHIGDRIKITSMVFNFNFSVITATGNPNQWIRLIYLLPRDFQYFETNAAAMIPNTSTQFFKPIDPTIYKKLYMDKYFCIGDVTQTTAIGGLAKWGDGWANPHRFKRKFKHSLWVNNSNGNVPQNCPVMYIIPYLNNIVTVVGDNRMYFTST